MIDQFLQHKTLVLIFYSSIFHNVGIKITAFRHKAFDPVFYHLILVFIPEIRYAPVREADQWCLSILPLFDYNFQSPGTVTGI